MSYFPMFVQLAHEPVLVLGTGPVAQHKKQLLEKFEANVQLAASDQDLDLTAYRLVVCALSSHEANAEIARQCVQLKIPCNVVDNKELSSFIFGSLIQDGPLTVGISTSGTSPAAAHYIKEEIQQILPPEFGQWLAWLGERREAIKTVSASQPVRAEIYKALFAAVLANQGPIDFEEWIKQYE